MVDEKIVWQRRLRDDAVGNFTELRVARGRYPDDPSVQSVIVPRLVLGHIGWLVLNRQKDLKIVNYFTADLFRPLGVEHLLLAKLCWVLLVPFIFAFCHDPQLHLLVHIASSEINSHLLLFVDDVLLLKNYAPDDDWSVHFVDHHETACEPDYFGLCVRGVRYFNTGSDLQCLLIWFQSHSPVQSNRCQIDFFRTVESIDLKLNLLVQ